MKPLLFLLIFINFSDQTPTNVYICNSDKATKYHYKSDCRGLSNCNYKIIKTTLEKAKKDKKTLCKWED